MVAKRAPALDAIDVKILAALQEDGRSTIQTLAARVGLSARACLERVRRLEQADHRPIEVIAREIGELAQSLSDQLIG